MKYIFIWQDGRYYKSDEITDDNVEAHESGRLDIIRVKDLRIMLRKGGFIEIAKWSG
jgi:hypothetical protein